MKPLETFYRTLRGRGGFESRCKACLALAERARQRAHREEVADRKRMKRLGDHAAALANDARIRREHPARRHRASLLHRHGISVEFFDYLAAQQGGACAICHKAETVLHKDSRRPHSLSVDHDHACCPGKRSCGKCVRGLLCRRCNTGLGSFGDRPETVDEAAAYLRGRR